MFLNTIIIALSNLRLDMNQGCAMLWLIILFTIIVLNLYFQTQRYEEGQA
jgi:hypothetical protein